MQVVRPLVDEKWPRSCSHLCGYPELESKMTRAMKHEVVADLAVIARSVASRLQELGGHEYHYRVAVAEALALCDALDVLGGQEARPRGDTSVSGLERGVV